MRALHGVGDALVEPRYRITVKETMATAFVNDTTTGVGVNTRWTASTDMDGRLGHVRGRAVQKFPVDLQYKRLFRVAGR